MLQGLEKEVTKKKKKKHSEFNDASCLDMQCYSIFRFMLQFYSYVENPNQVGRIINEIQY